MELGISMFGDLRWDEENRSYQSSAKRMKELLEEIKLMDEVGVDVFGIGEHHRPDYVISVPEILLAAAASVTKSIKLTSSVSVLSSSDPVRIFQSFSSIGLLSDGRSEITVGRGSFIESFPLFGYSLDDYEELFTEKLDLLLKLVNTKEPFSWNGKHRASFVDQEIYPQPEKSLDVWIAAGGTPASIIRAARLGVPLIFAIIGGMPAQYKPYFDLYKEEYLKAGHDLTKMQLGTHSHGLLGVYGKTLSKEYFSIYKQQMDYIGASRGWQPYTYEQFEGGRGKEGALFIGDPNEVVDKILYHQEMFGLTRWMMHMDLGAPSHSTIMKSIELYGDKVIPAVKKAIV